MMSLTLFRSLVILSTLALPSVSLAQELPLPVAELDRAEAIDFATEILPMLKQNCLACHHEKESEGGLILETIEGMTKGGDSGHGVVPGNVEESLLFTRAVGAEEPLMPPEDNSVGAKPLTPQQLALLKRWIEDGAKVGDAKMAATIQWQPIPETLRTVYSLDVSPDGQFAVVGRGNRVVVVDLATHAIVAHLVDKTLDVGDVTDVDLIQSVAVSPDGDRIATGGFRTVRLWRQTPRELKDQPSPLLTAAGVVTVHPNQTIAALVNAIGDIEVWDLSRNELQTTLMGNQERTTKLLWADNVDLLLSADEMGKLVLWSVASGQPLATFDTGSPIQDLAFSFDAKQIAWIDSTKQTHVLKVGDDHATLEKQLDKLGGVDGATAVALIHQPSAMAVVASGGGTVSLVSLPDNKVVRKFEHGAPVDVLVATQDQASLLTGGQDGKTQLWNLADGKTLATMQGNTKERLRIAAATRDAARQKAAVTRLTQKTESLKKLLEKEDEALKKVTEDHQKAVDALAGEEKKRGDAVALVAATNAKSRRHPSTLPMPTKRLMRLKKRWRLAKRVVTILRNRSRRRRPNSQPSTLWLKRLPRKSRLRPKR
ncbi:MAG: c-type cytochrome domain-containing protein [Rubripirellula sp.]